MSSSEFLKLKPGENKVRIVTEFEPFDSVYKGQTTRKFLCYVIDRADGQLKPMIAPVTVFRRLGELSVSSEYGFDSAVPPYDVIITRTGADKNTEYAVNAARSNTPLTEEEKGMILNAKPLKEIVENLISKQSRQSAQDDFDVPPPPDEPEL